MLNSKTLPTNLLKTLTLLEKKGSAWEYLSNFSSKLLSTIGMILIFFDIFPMNSIFTVRTFSHLYGNQRYYILPHRGCLVVKY